MENKVTDPMPRSLLTLIDVLNSGAEVISLQLTSLRKYGIVLSKKLQ